MMVTLPPSQALERSAMSAQQTSSSATPSQSFWALVTVASIGKQIGVLQGRLAPGSPEANELTELEDAFYGMLFAGLESQTASLTELAIRLDALTPSA